MKEVKENITTLLIVFVVLKLVDFNFKNPLDIILIVLAVLYAVLSIMDAVKRRGVK